MWPDIRLLFTEDFRDFIDSIIREQINNSKVEIAVYNANRLTHMWGGG